ncbi:MAG TPA: Fur family transcriptional regulator [Terriglobales bacterium]|nr:Fur family transcriptional regulator [Terriglobales bacterium]
MRTAEELVSLLRARGKKVTSQRVLIYQAVLGDRSHPTAEQIHSRLKDQLPGLSLTTVYAALSDLVQAGELRRFDAGDGSIHFDPEMRPHAELVCVRCGRIDDAPLEGPQRHTPSEVGGYRILRRTELLHGVCPTCQETGAQPD